jgi:single-strand DNA-binding protein
MNSVNVIGRLVADPDLRYTPNGAAVANVRIAVNNAGAFISEKEGYKAGFFSIVVWGKQAEALADYCAKGREIAVQGRLSQRDWEDDDGDVHYVTEIIAERIDFLREPKESSDDEERETRKGSKGSKSSKGGRKGRGR